MISLAITAACLFGPAGRLNWWNGWVLLGLSFLSGVAATAVVWRDPELVAERRNIKAGKRWDKVMVGFVVLLGPMATWITAGLDARYHWSTGLSSLTIAAGIAVAALGGALLVWAMGSNRFFSSVVRIQSDRGQTVVTSGPYRLIRHPGYAGTFAFLLATPLILNSRWALIPAAVTAAATMLRTALEDRTLRNELEGYADYARNVKYRLVPFVW
jgi:protein-S-isoprenylcysteine O-methyltransferase Ste14